MTPTIAATLGSDTQGRQGRTLDPKKDRDQTFGSLLADMAQSAAAQGPSARTELTSSPATVPSTTGATSGCATIPPTMIALLGVTADAASMSKPANPSRVAKPDVQSFLAGLPPSSTGAETAGGTTSTFAAIRGTAPSPAEEPALRELAPQSMRSSADIDPSAAPTTAQPPTATRAAASDLDKMSSTPPIRMPVLPTRAYRAGSPHPGNASATPDIAFDTASAGSFLTTTALQPSPRQPSKPTDAARHGTDEAAVAASTSADETSSTMALASFAFGEFLVRGTETPAVTGLAAATATSVVESAAGVATVPAGRPAAPGSDMPPMAADQDAVAPKIGVTAVKAALVGAASHPAPPAARMIGDGARAPALATAEDVSLSEGPTSKVAAAAADIVDDSPAGAGTPTSEMRPASDVTRISATAAQAGDATGGAVQAIAHAVTRLASQTTDAASATSAPQLADPTTARPSSAPARSLTLQLSPADLGSVTVHLRLRDGALDVRLSVEDQKTLGLITHARDTLSSAIGDGPVPLNSLVIQGNDAASPQTAGSHDFADRNYGGTSAGHDPGASGAGHHGAGGDAPRQPRGTPSRDSRALDAGSADGLFV